MSQASLLKTIFLFLFTLFFSPAVSGQDEEPLYTKKFTLKLGGGPTMMGTDMGYHLENQFVMELGKHMSLSASYGAAHAYSGMNDVKREYSPLPDLDDDDDFTSHQSLIYGRLGLQISPINTRHHRAYIGIGPSINFYNFSGSNIIATADTTIFIMSNRNAEVFTYSLFAGYEFTIKDRVVLGTALYYVSYIAEPNYSILCSLGYRFN